MTNSLNTAKSGCSELVLAIAVGAFFPAATNGIFSIVAGAGLNLGDEWLALLMQFIIASGPFILLAATGLGTRWAWGAALILTGLLWAYYLADGLSRRGDGTGANIGLGLMMVASPVVISFAALAIGRWTLATEKNDRTTTS